MRLDRTQDLLRKTRELHRWVCSIRAAANSGGFAIVLIAGLASILPVQEVRASGGEVDPAETAERTTKAWMGKAVLNKRAVKIGEVVAVELRPTGRLKAILVDTAKSGKEGLPKQLIFNQGNAKLTRYHVLVDLDKAGSRQESETRGASNTRNISTEQNRLESAWRVATENK